MNHRTVRFLSAVALFALTAPPPAQEIVREVPPGREVRDQKLLTLGKTDRWDLEVQKGEVLLCRVQSQAFDPVLQLVDGQGSVLVEHDGRGTRSEIWRRMRKTGKVAFRVSGYEGAGGGQYSFWLQRFRTQDVSIGESITHRFGPERWWNFAVPLKKGDVLVPTVTGSGRLTAVFHENRKHLGALFGGYRIETDGLHFVRIEGQHRHECLLHLALARQRDLSTTGVLDDTLPAHGLDIWRTPLRAHEPCYLALAMFDSILQFDLHEPKRGEGPPFVWAGSMDRGGLRRRWLMPRRHSTVELFLRNPAGAPAHYTGTFRPTGEALPKGQEIRRSLERCGASVFRLHTKPGELLSLRACSEMFDAQIDVWDREGNVIHKNDDTSLGDPNPSLTFPVTRPGDHWIIVFCPGGTGSGRFDLRMDSLPIPMIQAGQPKAFEFARTATRYAHLTLRRGEDFWVSMRSADFDSAISILAPDGKHLGTYEKGGIGENVLFGMRAPQDGRYTLHLHGRGKGTCELEIIRR